MSVSIQSCPSCRTLLLTDTVQCPLCQHVVDPEAAAQFSGELPDVVVVEDRSGGVECADCGEVVRPELVRCWRCGAFLRPEIAARYQEMQRNPSPVMYSQDQGAGELEDTGLGAAQQSSTSPGGAATIVEEEGFELADGVNMSDSADFDLDDGMLKPTQPVSADGQPAEPAAGSDAGTDAGTESGSEKSDDTAHPMAESGDALLDIAMSEEAETRTRRRQGSASVTRGSVRATAKTGFIVFCPNGHPIEVQERHRGKSGKCPKCQSPFLVPQQNWDPSQGDAESELPVDESAAQALFVEWLDDVHLHQVDPGSLKLKAGSLAAKFEVVDVGLSAENLVLVKLIKSGGLFGGGGGKKVSQVRDEVREHLEEVQVTDGLPAAEFISLAAETCEAMRIVQPAPYAHESMFAGIDVFGEGRIGIRLPEDPESKTIDFISLSLSEFRRISRRFGQLYGIDSFGAAVGVPLEDATRELTCHYNEETTMTVVEDATYYEADEAYEVTRVGYRCEGCGLIVSEDSRKKEKIGGKSGKGIAKAVCPKCKRVFGDNPLHEITLVETGEETGEDSGEDSGVETGQGSVEAPARDQAEATSASEAASAGDSSEAGDGDSAADEESAGDAVEAGDDVE